ncbi:MAG: ABC transporter ATP-binding protein [Polyangiaceae bacterium]|nr:ABC transporter ATP-binding protein [Polyangiaceae bacterium]
MPALDGLDLTVNAGQVYGFLGRNGAGKSSTLRIVMGVTAADSGSVSLFGKPVKQSFVAARQRLGYVAQEQHFYDWMTSEQLGSFVGALYPSWDEGYFRSLLQRFDVPSRKVRTLSGGMRVKLALALALGHRPALLTLDEPTAGLDAVARREFLEIVREQSVRGEHTTLFSSHLIDEVELVASHVGIIEAGRMLYEGPPQALAARMRRLTLPIQAPLPACLEVTAPTTESAVRIIQDRVLGQERELMLWATGPAVFELLALQELQGRLERPSLEDSFIALVRARAGLGSMVAGMATGMPTSIMPDIDAGLERM